MWPVYSLSHFTWNTVHTFCIKRDINQFLQEIYFNINEQADKEDPDTIITRQK